MKLSLILEQARAGELDAISKKDKTDKKVITYLNLAMIALYNRFVLATEEAIITLRPDLTKTVYTMDSSDDDVRVAGQPMDDSQFMSIEYALNEDGSEITINDESDPLSIFTVAYNQIQVPLVEKNSYISVIYRTNPPLVTFVDDGNGNAVDTEVQLPMQLLEAALHYIGYRAHGAVNGNIQAENNTHLTRYFNACNMAERLGVLTADDTVSESVQLKGFV